MCHSDHHQCVRISNCRYRWESESSIVLSFLFWPFVFHIYFPQGIYSDYFGPCFFSSRRLVVFSLLGVCLNESKRELSHFQWRQRPRLFLAASLVCTINLRRQSSFQGSSRWMYPTLQLEKNKIENMISVSTFTPEEPVWDQTWIFTYAIYWLFKSMRTSQKKGNPAFYWYLKWCIIVKTLSHFLFYYCVSSLTSERWECILLHVSESLRSILVGVSEIPLVSLIMSNRIFHSVQSLNHALITWLFYLGLMLVLV